MASFTPITDATDWAKISGTPAPLKEIADSVIERTISNLEPSPPAAPVLGQDVQAVTFWTAMQAHLEALAAQSGAVTLFSSRYIDHTQAAAPPPGYAGYAPPLPVYGVAAWRSNATINVAGFSRAQEWTPPAAPTWMYGQVQDDDILQYWVLDELQKGLNALRELQQYGTVILAGGLQRLVINMLLSFPSVPFDLDGYGIRASDGLLQWEGSLFNVTTTPSYIQTPRAPGYYTGSFWVIRPTFSYTI